MSRLADDHRHARRFAERVEGVSGCRVVPPDTNMVMMDLPPGVRSFDVQARAKEAGVLVSVWSNTRIRAVAHLDVDEAAMTRAGDIVREAIVAAAAAASSAR
jgi:threonine aldolase